MFIYYSNYQQCVFRMKMLFIEYIQTMRFSYDQIGPIGLEHVCRLGSGSCIVLARYLCSLRMITMWVLEIFYFYVEVSRE